MIPNKYISLAIYKYFLGGFLWDFLAVALLKGKLKSNSNSLRKRQGRLPSVVRNAVKYTVRLYMEMAHFGDGAVVATP